MLDEIVAVVSFVGGLAGIIGLFLVIFPPQKRPLCIIQTTELINKNIDGINSLTVSWNSKPIQALAITKILLWNAGRQIIRSSDISQPLQISLIKGEILESLFYTVEEQENFNKFEYTFSQNSSVLKFEFLEKQQGCIIELLHTASSNKDIKITCYIQESRHRNFLQVNGGNLLIKLVLRLNNKYISNIILGIPSQLFSKYKSKNYKIIPKLE